MGRVEEIEAAIDSLSAEDYQRLVKWFRERDSKLWEDQIDRDSESGKLDFLFEEAERESAAGTLQMWPPAS